MVLGPKHAVAVTTEEEEEDCCVDGIIVKLLYFSIDNEHPKIFVPFNV
jgi:hypothetical protein